MVSNIVLLVTDNANMELQKQGSEMEFLIFLQIIISLQTIAFQ